jgi:RNA polymerase sigma-70 factor (ECF subfamily)
MHLHEFKEKVLHLKDRLYRYALAIMKHREDAEDLVQEVMLKLWVMRGKMDQYNSIEALAIRMIRNAALNKLKEKERQWVNVENANFKTTGNDPDKLLERKEVLDLVLRTIDELPTQQRWVILLREIEGLEVEEIAQITDMTVNNIRVSLSLGRKRLITLYNDLYGKE